MRIVESSVNFDEVLDGEEILKRLERAGRTCYKSEERITKDSAHKFVAGIIKSGHESVIEHVSVSVRFICDRGVSHEIVRHRLASYSQESTRYCNYKNKEMEFIKPSTIEEDSVAFAVWKDAMMIAESEYKGMLLCGCKPEIARSVIPNSLKTEIVMTCNLREWRTVLRLRTAKAAHPQMREVMIPLLRMFQGAIPVVFDDIKVDGE